MKSAIEAVSAPTVKKQLTWRLDLSPWHVQPLSPVPAPTVALESAGHMHFAIVFRCFRPRDMNLPRHPLNRGVADAASITGCALPSLPVTRLHKSFAPGVTHPRVAHRASVVYLSFVFFRCMRQC